MRIVDLFRRFQSILGICPCCGAWFRLSDAQLFIRGPAPTTPFDELLTTQRKVDLAVERFDVREAGIREAARQRGQLKARRRLKKIVGWCSKNRFDPNDVKVLFDPVEYVAFVGLNTQGCSRITFIDRPPQTTRKEQIIRSLGRAIQRGNFQWRTYRVTDAGHITVED
jgi:predicted Holliday junction resolvase-like endonuclease